MTQLDMDVARLKARSFDWPVAWEAVELIARAEACRLVAYLCPAGVWTIGWGETAGGSIKRGMKWKAEEADSRFFHELCRYVDRVAAMVREDASENELGAMTSLAYNIGTKAFCGSTVVRRFNAGDYRGACDAFLMWNKPKEIIGRRTGEMRQFLSGAPKEK